MVKDMTQGSTLKLLLFFSVPLLIGNIFQQFYNFADTAIVGKTLGYKQLAAVGSTGSVIFLIFGFFFGLTSGLAVVTGQRFGANDPEGVRKSVAASTIICTVFSIVSTVVCCLLTPQVLRWMHTPDDIFQEAYAYMFVMFLGMATIVFYGMLSSILRALGDSITPLVFLAVSCLLNIGLDLLFILKYSWGVSGAAWATVIAQGLSAVLCLIYIIWKFPILHLHLCNWNVSFRFYMEHFRISLPMALQFSITALGIVVLQAVLNDFGSEYIAGTTAAARIDSITIQPMFSFGIAIAAFAAQNYGARNVERIRHGVYVCSAMALSFSLITGLLTIYYGSPLTRLFMSKVNEAVVKNSQIYININCSFYLVLTMLLIYRNVLQGMGHTFFPMLAGVAELLLRVFAALFLAKIWGYEGVCFAHPLAWIGATLVLFADYMYVMHKLRKYGVPSKNDLVRRTEKTYLSGTEK